MKIIRILGTFIGSEIWNEIRLTEKAIKLSSRGGYPAFSLKKLHEMEKPPSL